MKRLILGLVCVFGLAQANATVISYEGSLDSGVVATGDVPLNSYTTPAVWDFWSFYGTAGDIVSIALDRASDQMDPGVELYFGLGGDTDGLAAFSGSSSIDGLLSFLDFDDDSGSDVPAGPFRNSLIEDYVLGSTGTYTIAVYDVLGDSTGPWTYNLTATGFSGTQVPEPASLLLMAMGLFGIRALKKKSL